MIEKVEPMTKTGAAALPTPSDLDGCATMTVADALRVILADAYAIYLKTKSFHWHVSGPYFRDYHLLLDEQAAEILAVTDAIAISPPDAVLFRSLIFNDSPEFPPPDRYPLISRTDACLMARKTFRRSGNRPFSAPERSREGH